MSTETRSDIAIDRRRLPLFDYVVLVALLVLLGFGTLGSVGRGVDRQLRCVSAAIGGDTRAPGAAAAVGVPAGKGSKEARPAAEGVRGRGGRRCGAGSTDR